MACCVTYLPVRDAEFYQQPNDKRHGGTGDTWVELTEYVTVNQYVRSIPEEQYERSEQKEVEYRVHCVELGARQHFLSCAKTDDVDKISARAETNSRTVSVLTQ